ncbi:MAG TPA: hypothetical protein ENN18_10425 [Proteobacteria bacterium]|nr:hypothetical protein [Pseudomonadota bacterium]
MNSRRRFLICFTGIDGSGKTTLSKELVASLNQKGVKCKYVYARLNPFMLKPFIILGEWIFLRRKNISHNYHDYSNTKKIAIKRHSFLSGLYQKILLFDYFIQIFFKVKLPLVFGKSIVCDRYVYDTVITDLSVDMNYSKDKALELINKLHHFFPEPDMTFLIDLPEEIAFHRKNDTPSLDYLKDRRELYLEIGEEYDMIFLDGLQTLEQLKQKIEQTVLQ